MKKLNIFLAAGIALAMSSCTEDFTTNTPPQSNPQEHVLQVSDVTVTPSEQQQVSYDAEKEITLGTMTVNNWLLLPNSYIQSPNVQVSKTEDFEKYQVIATRSMKDTDLVSISVQDLQNAIYDSGLYIDNDPVTLYFRTISQLVTNSTSISNVGGEAYYYALGNVVYTPMFHENLPEYYMVGNVNDWKYTKDKISALFPTSLKTFTYSSYFAGSWDCKICKLVKGEYKEYYFAKTDNDGSCTELAFEGGCITAPAAGYYTINIDLNTNTYSWTPVTNPTEYTTPGIGIIGANDKWGDNDDLVMTQVKTSSGNPSHVWFYKGMVITNKAWGVHFRTVGSWTKEWGNSNPTVDRTCTYAKCDGKNNIPVEVGTYDVYFNDITEQFLLIKQD